MSNRFANDTVNPRAARESVGAVKMLHVVQGNLAGCGGGGDRSVGQRTSLAQSENARGGGPASPMGTATKFLEFRARRKRRTLSWMVRASAAILTASTAPWAGGFMRRGKSGVRSKSWTESKTRGGTGNSRTDWPGSCARFRLRVSHHWQPTSRA